METYHGSCHCGAVRFEVDTELNAVTQCNCTICDKKGSLLHRVPPERFRLLAGEDALVLYQFNTKVAKHYFCRHCGIHPFHRPRAAPEIYNINVRCLDDFDREAAGLRVNTFDGKNWEEAFKKARLS